MAKTTSCNTCAKPATDCCVACKNTVTTSGIVNSIYYCSRTCQTTDWKNHKTECSARKTRLVVFRIGHILQEMFLIYRQYLFELEITKVEEKDDVLYVHDGLYNRGDRHGADLIKEFPLELVKNDEQKRMLLAHMSCSDVVLMQELIYYLLGDLSTSITQRAFIVKDPVKQVVTITSEGQVLTGRGHRGEHTIIIVELKNGENYVLDLTGIQFGWQEPVMIKSTYFDTRVTRFFNEKPTPLSTALQSYINDPQTSGVPNHEAVVANNLVAMRGFTVKVRAWEDVQKLRVRDLCKLAEKDYQGKKSLLLAQYRFFMCESTKDYKRQYEVAYWAGQRAKKG